MFSLCIINVGLREREYIKKCRVDEYKLLLVMKYSKFFFYMNFFSLKTRKGRVNKITLIRIGIRH